MPNLRSSGVNPSDFEKPPAIGRSGKQSKKDPPPSDEVLKSGKGRKQQARAATQPRENGRFVKRIPASVAMPMVVGTGHEPSTNTPKMPTAMTTEGRVDGVDENEDLDPQGQPLSGVEDQVNEQGYAHKTPHNNEEALGEDPEPMEVHEDGGVGDDKVQQEQHCDDEDEERSHDEQGREDRREDDDQWESSDSDYSQSRSRLKADRRRSGVPSSTDDDDEEEEEEEEEEGIQEPPLLSQPSKRTAVAASLKARGKRSNAATKSFEKHIHPISSPARSSPSPTIPHAGAGKTIAATAGAAVAMGNVEEEAHDPPGEEEQDGSDGTPGPQRFKPGPLSGDCKKELDFLAERYREAVTKISNTYDKSPDTLYQYLNRTIVSPRAPTVWNIYQKYQSINGPTKPMNIPLAEWNRSMSQDYDDRIQMRQEELQVEKLSTEQMKELFEEEIAWWEAHQIAVNDALLEDGAMHASVKDMVEPLNVHALKIYEEHNAHVFGYIIFTKRDGSGRSCSAMWGPTPQYAQVKAENKSVINEHLSDLEAMFRVTDLVNAGNAKSVAKLSVALETRKKGHDGDRAMIKKFFEADTKGLVGKAITADSFVKHAWKYRLCVLGWPSGVPFPTTGKGSFTKLDTDDAKRVVEPRETYVRAVVEGRLEESYVQEPRHMRIESWTDDEMRLPLAEARKVPVVFDENGKALYMAGDSQEFGKGGFYHPQLSDDDPVPTVKPRQKRKHKAVVDSRHMEQLQRQRDAEGVAERLREIHALERQQTTLDYKKRRLDLETDSIAEELADPRSQKRRYVPSNFERVSVEPGSELDDELGFDYQEGLTARASPPPVRKARRGGRPLPPVEHDNRMVRSRNTPSTIYQSRDKRTRYESSSYIQSQLDGHSESEFTAERRANESSRSSSHVRSRTQRAAPDLEDRRSNLKRPRSEVIDRGSRPPGRVPHGSRPVAGPSRSQARNPEDDEDQRHEQRYRSKGRGTTPSYYDQDANYDRDDDADLEHGAYSDHESYPNFKKMRVAHGRRTAA